MTIPTSTYRIQFRNGMTFDRAAALVPYLKRLGISHLYASPIFTAAADSTHGYDVADANEIDPTIGGREGFDRLSDALKQHGIGLILDIVPNHMAASLENRWWRSVVEWGEDSRFSHFFDADWTRRLTLPFLGEDFEAVAGKGDMALCLDPDAGCLAFCYFDSRYPLSPATYALALDGIDHPLAERIRQAAALATPEDEDDFHAEMKQLAATEDRPGLDAALAEMAGDPARLKVLHDAQPYRLMNWRDAPSDLSYRRFFEITGLAGLRVETEEVFSESHRLTIELVLSGQVDGLRIDHVDGLADPRGYLARLREAVGPDCYLVVEKILARNERLPFDWPVAGTTGYEFIAALSEALVDREALPRLNALYGEVAGRILDPQAELREAKARMVDVNFAGEFARLARLAGEIAASHDDAGRIEETALKTALRDLLLAFPIYRTYGTDMGLEPADRQRLTEILESVRALPSPPQPQALGFLARILAGDVTGSEDARAAEFRTRFQQLTGPLMAKSLEDTLFFRLNPMIGLNEVGGEPMPEIGGLPEFHRLMARRFEEQPAGLSATSTHDTKRGEDARARLYALGEAPELWSGALSRWRHMNRAAVQALPTGPAPEPEVEWLIFQALAGVWPQDLTAEDVDGLQRLEERFVAYLEKAMREAKLRTGWDQPDEAYEAAVTDYARQLLSPDAVDFRRDFIAFLSPVLLAGAINGITQTLIKLCAPGIADIYQGSEGLDLSLVDPDNRRPPDFEALIAGLDCTCDPADPQAWLDGRLKQRLIQHLLAHRGRRPDLFAKGEYVPLAASGERARQILAFGRRTADQSLLVIAPRLMLGVLEGRGDRLPPPDAWRDTAVHLTERFGGRRFRDLVSDDILDPGAELEVRSLFATRPFAILLST